MSRITRDPELGKLSGFINLDQQAHDEWMLLKDTKYKISRKEAYENALKMWFASYTSLGAYPILFSIADEGCILCSDCAKKIFLEDRKDINLDIYYEGPVEYCEECNKEIKSAYGDPGEEGNQMNFQEALNLKSGDYIHHAIRKNGDGSPMRARITSIKKWKTRPKEKRTL